MKPHEAGERAIFRGEGEGPVGRGDESPGKGDALRLVALEQTSARSLLENRGKLPCQVDGVTNPGIHPLSAHRTVNVGRISEEKCSAAAEVVGNAVMHAVGREPVDAVDLHLHPLAELLAHIAPHQVALVLGIALYRAQQPSTVAPLHREDSQQVGLVERDVELVIGDGPLQLDVGNVEHPLVRAARKPDGEDFANPGMSAITPSDVGGLAVFGATVIVLQPCDDAVASILEAKKLRAALDLDTGATQMFDEQLLVLVLRNNKGKREGAQALADVETRAACSPRAQKLMAANSSPRSMTSCARPSCW
jgi:hypothetical protein